MFSIEHCKHRVKCNKRTSHSPFLNTSIQNYKYVNNTSTQDKPLNINKNTIQSADRENFFLLLNIGIIWASSLILENYPDTSSG